MISDEIFILIEQNDIWWNLQNLKFLNWLQQKYYVYKK